jgi:hypothetical protein
MRLPTQRCLDAEVEVDIALGLIDLRPFELHGELLSASGGTGFSLPGT